MAYEIVPTTGGENPLDLLIEQEALAAYQWDCELEADSPIQNREEFSRSSTPLRHSVGSG